ncbi:FG-GAP-like repeat-containing protein [Bacteroides sp.]|uniref:FG-GAP-like repeat-containing protein n=1 Tax=Bacteroides sp. TaxID=29523 RepID=UPI0025BF6F0D|nr:FG-GAP-like repeat-containing protein [Bacteroides sp.]
MRTYLSIILSVLLFPVVIYGQVGNTMATPIVAGTYNADFDYTDLINTANFTDNYGCATNDVYYKFTLNEIMEVTIYHCDSYPYSNLTDTFISLLDDSGNLIAFTEHGTCEPEICGKPQLIFIKKDLDPGTYYVVTEGCCENGLIQTYISGELKFKLDIDRVSSIPLGTYSVSTKFSNTQNSAYLTSQHPRRPSNDIFYKFAITRRMNVTITHCGSELENTYMYLLNASGHTIAYNDDYSGDGQCSSKYHSFIQKSLEPGTYYVVSEEYNSSGNITTNITLFAPDDPDYPDVPSAYSTEPEEVGGIGGSLDVSPTGGAIYSIPIKVPQGVGGLQPSLSILYNSQSGNGIVGWGCNLSSVSTITRGPKTVYHDGVAAGMTFSADEAYYMDGKRLIYHSGAVGQEGAIYYPESDPFTKVIVHGTYNSTVANTWFEVKSPDGKIYYYGNTPGARQSYTAGGSPKIYAWYLDYVEDPLGNYMNYTYNQWNYYMYPGSITYGKNKNGSNSLLNKITFHYEIRSNDPQPFVIEGVKGIMNYRLIGISSETGSSVYRRYYLQYDTNSDGSGTEFSRLTNVTEKNGNGEALKPVELTWSYLPGMSNAPVSPQVNAASVYPAVAFSEQKFIAGDFNGDGLTDMMGIAPVQIPTGSGSWTGDTYAYIYWASRGSSGTVQFTTGTNYRLGPSFNLGDMQEQKAGSSILDFDGDGLNEFVVPHVSINNHWKQIGFYIYGNTVQGVYGYDLQNSNEMPAYATGDFNNDGKGDLIFIEKGHNPDKYPGEIITFNSEKITFNLTMPSAPDEIFVSDLNGNGLEDLMVIYDGGYTIFWNKGNGITNTTFSDAKKTTGTNIYNVNMMRSGDFNGDGLMDLLMNDTDNNQWNFALNNGDGTFTKLQACTLEVYDQSFTGKDDQRFNCIVYDFNFDGKSDVVITKAMYKKKSDITGSWGEFTKTHTYWMHSTGSELVQVRHATSNIEDDALSSRYMVGDFNGDGQAELMNFGYNCYSSSNATGNPEWRLYGNRGYEYNNNCGKVISVTSDYGSITTIDYTSLTDGHIYTKGLGSSYPIVDCTLPLHVVECVTTDYNYKAGIVNLQRTYTHYRYKGLKLHLQGKGMLGLSSMTAENTSLGIVSESGVKAWNTSYYIPSATYTKHTVGGSTAETNVTFTIVDKGSKKYFAYPATTIEKDLDNHTITTTRQFNTTYGYITQEKTVYDNDNTMYHTVQYSNYTLAGKAYHPGLITKIQKHKDDASPFIQKTQITYDIPFGYQTQIIENNASNLRLVTNSRCDTWGNLFISSKSGTGVSTPIQYYEYDATKRFVTKSYTSSPLSPVITYTYDTWGNVLTENDESDLSNILTTTYTYDGWGNKTSTTFPDGTKETYLRGWNNNLDKRFFTLTQATGKPWVKIWYDSRGREVLVESIGPGGINKSGISIKQSTTYNIKNQVTKKQIQTGDLTTTEEYTYDGRGRVLTQANGTGQSISYTYGDRSISTTTNGRTTTKVYDAWDGVKSVIDPISSITYTYSSVGSPAKITTGGVDFTMTYNDVGRQKTLTDPNTGTTTYTYDAAGRIKTQVDGKNKTTTNTYDILGRLTSTVIDGVSTTYTYGTSGSSFARLTKEQTGNNSISYTYDDYGRIDVENRQVDGTEALAFTYSYNNKGQLSTITYPGDFTVSHFYDAYGNLNHVTKGTPESQTDVWMLLSNTGTITSSMLGSEHVIATKTLNSQGLLTNQNVSNTYTNTVFHNMDYVFDGATGNLTSRTGMIPQMESFTYDHADRLTEVREGNSTAISMGYHLNGNITSKTGLGSYSYGGKPHAISTVDNTSGLISGNLQNIAYTAFNKVSSISETVGSDNYLLNITYGPDRQRWKSVLKKNNIVTRTTVYAGDYEKITENGVTKGLYYISGDDGLVAVCVKEPGQSDKTYYAYKDHLGSIMTLAEISGDEVFKASYDVWGKRTVTNNTFKFHRGYTGHEHLDEFQLIDMNGRMYDPLLARFLSPDPFVQMPDFSQSFNRYSYCVNNPLIYTDPDGEFWHIVIGAVVGGAINWISNGADFSWEGLSYFATGAASGALTMAFPGAAMGIAAGTGAINSTLNQGFNNGWNNISLPQIAFDGIMAGAMSYAGGQVAGKFSAPLDKLTKNIQSPLLKNLITHEISGLPFGTLMGGVVAELDDNPETSFLDGMWNGAKMSLMTSGLSAIGAAAQYSLDNKANVLTGKPILPKEMHHFATNKNSRFTPQMEDIVEKYGLNLDGDWNKAKLPHTGRHPNKYHQWTLDRMTEIDAMPGMNQQAFIKQFKLRVIKPVINNPWMLKKSFWINK